MSENKIFPNIETLAYHFANSNDIKKGIYYLKSAADKSYRYYALKEALNFFEQALKLLGKKQLSQEELQDKLEILRRQSLVLRIMGNLPRALKEQKQSLKIARSISSLKDEAGAYINIGKLYQEMGLLNRALSYWKRAIKISKNIGDKNIQSLTINNIGTYYLQVGDMNKAYNNFKQVLELSKEIGDKRGMAFAYLNLGTVMDRKGEFMQALEYYNNAYRYFEDAGDKENTLRSLHKKAIVQMCIGQFNECLKNFNIVVEHALKFGDRIMELFALSSIGEAYGRMWQLDEALEQFLKSLAIAQILNEPQQMTVLNINIGDVHLYQGRLSRAIEHHKKSIEIAKQTQDYFNEALAQRSLGWDYYYSAEYKQAIEEFQRSESIFQKIGDIRSGVISNLARTAALFKIGDIEEIEPIIKGIGAKAKEINDLEILALALDIEADCLIFKKNNEGALEVLSQLKDLSKKIGNKRLYAWTIVKSGNIQRGMNLTKEIGDKILETKILISQAKKFEKNSDYKNALITLNKATEQAEQCGAKEFNAEALFLISEIFTKIGKENEGKTYKNKYNKIIKEITKNFSRKEKDRYTERFSQCTLDLF